MARGGIALALSIGCAVAFASQITSPVTRGGTNAAQQMSKQVPASDSQHLRDEIKALEQLLPRLVDRGAALFLLAHDYARLGDLAKALDLLKQCVALDEGFDPGGDRVFAPLRSRSEFLNLVESVQRQNPPIHRARVAFTVAQNDLFPEGLAVDASKRVFYMGSEYHNKIVRVSETGEVADFVKEAVYD